MASLLTAADLEFAAKQIGCDVAAIRAVDDVESSGSGFRNGQIVIGFDAVNAATFKEYTGQKISGTGLEAYNKAYQINSEKAMLAASWGRYQLAGYNFHACGYDSVESFVAGMKTSEQAQLGAFVAFVNKRAIADDLANHDWSGFALVYNIRNGYAAKLAKAYTKYEGKAATVPYQIQDSEIGLTDGGESTIFGLTTRELILMVLMGVLLLGIVIFAFRSPQPGPTAGA